MQIILDKSLKRATKKIHLPIANLASTIERKLDRSVGHRLVASTISRRVETLQEGFLSCVSRSYSDHEKLQLAPHDIWYLVLSEIAIIIRKNVDACRPLFTRSQEKLDICVPVGDTSEIDLDIIVDRLRELIPVDITVFIPELSTHTVQSRVAMYAALCDGVQAYYSYSNYCCGIPEIRLTGTKEDWSKLVSCALDVRALFEKVSLDTGVEYMIRVATILEKIEQSFAVADVEFWRGIFTSKNVGSGGELLINGWIKDLYFEKREMSTLQSYMTSATVVPFYSQSVDKHYKTVFGAFERHRTDDGFIYSEYASLTFEVDEDKKSGQKNISTVSKMIDGILTNPMDVDL
jgi:hypothetical protein